MVSNREVHCVAGFLLKTTTPTHHQRELVLSPYSPDRKLSIVTSLRACLEGTKVLCQGETRLLISFKKPHKCILRDTLRRWMKTVLDLAGIRMDVFTPHSTRTAPTTKVVDKIPLKTLLQTASWWNGSTLWLSTTRRFRRKDSSWQRYYLEVSSLSWMPTALKLSL